MFPGSSQICHLDWSDYLHHLGNHVKSTTNSRMGRIKCLSTSVREAIKLAMERKAGFFPERSVFHNVFETHLSIPQPLKYFTFIVLWKHMI